ncbi:putative splicing factor, arginine/serine-rich 5 [Caenorhabditis elegans]|uniref:Isoform b of Probable splicing factor, arginine/serine-rich 5 n=1 Tax=Caenorhabditis elegans TaxID=6239 RepID=Q10021-2|nr:putative splicing factor, arginine/serine-rich 5 [Caenorhabditis elegans]CCD72698.1 Probable splicing factor, arginine/serine-rich 5 [Caenorhabditis elegans]|eukprot:NP_495309.3 Probable splicing factor, arginine/serine-rich 5 [Caenorhabditis elegans]
MPRLYLGKIPYNARERDVERFLKGYGKINNISMKYGFAFVDFEDSRDAEDACHDLDGKTMEGSSMRLVVEMARGKPRGNDRHGSRSPRRRSRSPRRRSRTPPRRRSRSRDRKRSRRSRSRSSSRSRSPVRESRRRSESRSPSPKRDFHSSMRNQYHLQAHIAMAYT